MCDKGKTTYIRAFPKTVEVKPLIGFGQLCIDLAHLEPSPGVERDPPSRYCRKERLYGAGWAIQPVYITITIFHSHKISRE